MLPRLGALRSAVSTLFLLNSPEIGVGWTSSRRFFTRGGKLPRKLAQAPELQHCNSLTRNMSGDSSIDVVRAKDSIVLPYKESSHRSATIVVPDEPGSPLFAAGSFAKRLEDTIQCCREQEMSSIWIRVPMSQSTLIQEGEMQSLGFQCHHTEGNQVVLNLWLKDTPSKVPDFATHNVGVGAVVVNSRDEILCVRELRRNYMPWKTPTGLTDLGEEIGDAAEREVFEETGIRTKFRSVLSFRQTHNLAFGRSDMFFVCQLDPVEHVDEETGKTVIDEPTPEASEIERAAWVPLSEYRGMINDPEHGHPMMSRVIRIYDDHLAIAKETVTSVVPGRKPNSVYSPRRLD